MESNIFFSWSGARSQKLAEEFFRFLPDIIQKAKPWMSGKIEKGRRWSPELATALQDARIGIVFLTPENLEAPWILFESGALAKIVNTAHMCPYLLGVEKKDVSKPLADFQLTEANEHDTRELLHTLNRALDAGIEEPRLARTFEQFWPELAKNIDRIRKETPALAAPKRSDNDLLGEILLRVRGIEQRVDTRNPIASTHNPGSLGASLGRLETDIKQLEARSGSQRTPHSSKHY